MEQTTEQSLFFSLNNFYFLSTEGNTERCPSTLSIFYLSAFYILNGLIEITGVKCHKLTVSKNINLQLLLVFLKVTVFYKVSWL
jgi:hypothetical protein